MKYDKGLSEMNIFRSRAGRVEGNTGQFDGNNVDEPNMSAKLEVGRSILLYAFQIR